MEDTELARYIEHATYGVQSGNFPLEEAIRKIAGIVSAQNHCAHIQPDTKSAVRLDALEGGQPEWGMPKRYVYGGRCDICYAKFDAKTAIRLVNAGKSHPPDYLTPVEFTHEVLVPSVPTEDLLTMAREMGYRLPAQQRRELVRALVAHDAVTDIFPDAA